MFENKISSMNGANLSTIMYSWTRQFGHPVVNIKRLNSTHFSVSQSPFSIGPSNGGYEKFINRYSLTRRAVPQNIFTMKI